MIKSLKKNKSASTPNIKSKLFKLIGISSVLLTLNGCLLTSPYWNQVFESRTDLIPLQAWTTEKDKDVRFECATAYHGGLYPPYGGSVNWIHVVTATPQVQSLKDSDGNKVYGAGKKRVLPADCWRQDSNDIWYSAIRAVQGTGSDRIEYNTFDKVGLECLGKEVGKLTNWFGWLNKGCIKTYSGSQTNIPFVAFRANS